jgi:uncharacterized membrane protein
MWVLTVVCLVLSGVFSLLSVVRGVTAEKRWSKTSHYQWDVRNTVATVFLVVALVLALIGMANGHFNGQELTATINLVAGGLWLAASVYRVRWFIHNTGKAVVKLVID